VTEEPVTEDPVTEEPTPERRKSMSLAADSPSTGNLFAGELATDSLIAETPGRRQPRVHVLGCQPGRPALQQIRTGERTNVIDGPALDAAAEIWNKSASPPYHLRTPEQIQQFFDGLELIEPGVVSCPLWRPGEFDIGDPVELDQFGGVGRKG
jgi:S-adenosyl methyltransferase